MVVTQKKEDVGAEVDPTVGLASVNEVHLVGRLSSALVERELASGDVLGTFRVVAERMEPARSGRRRVDAIDCHVWAVRLRRKASGWRIGDVVELDGALRRRFFRSGSGVHSMTEVEVMKARLVRRVSS